MRQQNKGGKAVAPPWAFTSRAFLLRILEMLAEKIEKTNMNTSDKQMFTEAGVNVQQFLQELMTAGPKKIATFIRHFQTKTIRDQTKAIVMIQFSSLYQRHQEVERSVHAIVEVLGAELMDGMEPATPMERAVQSEIEKLKK